MKKNNKFRNGGANSNAYSLNYRFDSISPAGKVSGTALDLIKKYNELAKEAHGSGDYIEMEIYRQYAEHYRKIVTEINERKNARIENAANTVSAQERSPDQDNSQENTTEDSAVTNKAAADDTVQKSTDEPAKADGKLKITAKKSFKIIEIQPQQNNADMTETGNETTVKRKRCTRRKPETNAQPAETAAAAVV